MVLNGTFFFCITMEVLWLLFKFSLKDTFVSSHSLAETNKTELRDVNLQSRVYISLQYVAETSFHKFRHLPAGANRCRTLMGKSMSGAHGNSKSLCFKKACMKEWMNSTKSNIWLQLRSPLICLSSGSSYCQRKEEKSPRWETNDRKGEITAIFINLSEIVM